MSPTLSHHEQTLTALTEDDLRTLIQRLERRDFAKVPLSSLDMGRLHFLSHNFETAHPRALDWAFDTAQRCLKR